jgi:hypothetical protein
MSAPGNAVPAGRRKLRISSGGLSFPSQASRHRDNHVSRVGTVHRFRPCSPPSGVQRDTNRRDGGRIAYSLFISPSVGETIYRSPLSTRNTRRDKALNLPGIPPDSSGGVPGAGQDNRIPFSGKRGRLPRNRYRIFDPDTDSESDRGQTASDIENGIVRLRAAPPRETSCWTG